MFHPDVEEVFTLPKMQAETSLLSHTCKGIWLWPGQAHAKVKQSATALKILQIKCKMYKPKLKKADKIKLKKAADAFLEYYEYLPLIQAGGQHRKKATSGLVVP